MTQILFLPPQQLEIGNMVTTYMKIVDFWYNNAFLSFSFYNVNYFRYRGLIPVLKRVYDTFVTR